MIDQSVNQSSEDLILPVISQRVSCAFALSS